MSTVMITVDIDNIITIIIYYTCQYAFWSQLYRMSYSNEEYALEFKVDGTTVTVLYDCALYCNNIMQAFRIHVTLKEATSWPITFFTKEQNTGSAISFGVPTQPEGYAI